MASNRLFIFVFVCGCLLGSAVHSFITDDTKIRLYSKNFSYVEVNARDAIKLLPLLDLSKKTLLHCHGYLQSADEDNVKSLTRNFLDGFDYNIVIADYRHVTLRDYLTTVALLDKVAEFLAQGLQSLMNAGVSPEMILITGHSLGGQVAGKIGRKLDPKIAEIMAVDPAGPLFQFVQKSLSASDAKCVKCIHTDAGFYGTFHDCGHIDYFPNGGTREQPGCKLFSLGDLPNACSHGRSEIYLAESVMNPNGFLGVKCNSWADFKRGKCDESVIIPMGVSAPCNVSGKFYLQTNKESPFAEGYSGTVYNG